MGLSDTATDSGNHCLPIVDSDAPEILQSGELKSSQHIDTEHDRRDVLTTSDELSQLCQFAFAEKLALLHLPH